MATNEGNGDKEYEVRQYQIDLYNAAKEQNIIACLGTGTGKTYISILLMIDPMFLPQLNGSYREGVAKRTFFLAPTRPLVHQQAEAIRTAPSITNLKEYVIGITGDMNVDLWDESKWDEVLEQNKVIVMTPQILYDMLSHNYISFDRINLLIIDEVHWGARKKNKKESGHPYKQIMNLYNKLDVNTRPRVLGLSATPINCSMRVENFAEAVADIEKAYSAMCMTGDAGKYGTNPEEIVWCFNNYEKTLSKSGVLVKNSLEFFIESLKTTHKSLKELLKDKRKIPSIVTRLKKILSTIRNILAEPSQTDSFITDEQSGERFPLFMTWMGTWCASNAIRFYIEEIQEYSEIYRDVDPFQSNLMDCSLKYLNFIIKSLAPELDSDPMAALNTASPKMLKLLELLRNYQTSGGQESIICDIIFVNQRCVAKVLADWLMEMKRIQPQYYGFINVGWVVGHAARPGLEAKIAFNSDKKQQKVIKQFKEKELNVLVATSVLEEGLDVRKCNLVVRYDRLNTFREYLQSKGRARADNASYYMMTSNEDSGKLWTQLNDFRQMEEMVKNINNKVRTEYEIQEEVEEDSDLISLISPTGAQISARESISKLYKYCQSLTTDSFTRLEPVFKIKYELSQFRATVKMPVNCPLKGTIEGPLKSSGDNAKRAVALKAYQLLHELGELDDNLLPVKKEKYIGVYIEKLGLRSDTFSTDSSEKVGTRSKKDVVSKLIANVFTNDSNVKNRYYLQRISISFSKTIPLPDNCLTFGALTPKLIPYSTEFSVYLKTIPTETTDGNKIVIKVNQISEMALNGEQKEMIEKFHCNVFEEVIRISVKDYNFDPINSKFNLLVVPLKNKQNIDWDFIKKINTLGPVVDVKPVSPSDRQRYVFNEQSFNDTVFSPGYKQLDQNGRPVVYYFLGITTKTSNSDWDGPQEFKTFADFYEKTKGIEIKHKSQPMIEGRCINRQLIGGSKCAQLKPVPLKSNLKSKNREYFPPEVVRIHPFPASLWRQALCLPTLFYRMNHLLLAEELRIRIQLETIPRIRPLITLSNELNLNFDSMTTTYSVPNKSKRDDSFIDSDDECEGHIINDQFEDDNQYRHPFPKRQRNESKQIRQCLDITVKTTPSTTPHNSEVCWDSFLASLMEYTNAMVYNFKEMLMGHFTGNTNTFLTEQMTLAKILSEINSKPIRAAPDLSYGDAFPFIFKGDIQSQIKERYDTRVDEPIVGPNTDRILQALTTIGADDAMNLERLEVIGDSFLKFVSSAFVYFSCPELDEGRLSYLRQIQICNCNLYFIGCEKEIEKRLVSHRWLPNTNWLPPSYHISDQKDKQLLDQKEKTCGSYRHRYIGNKTIADSVEALIGAHLLYGNTKTALIFMEWLGLKVAPKEALPIDYENKKNLSSDQMFRWLPSPKNPICYESTQEEIDLFVNRHYTGANLKNFEEILGYEFKNKAFLIQALTHSSFHSIELTDCYQKLEFLGDSIIDYLISRHIYAIHEYSPGELTNLRSALVNNAFFAAICVKYKFHKFLKAISPELFRGIQNFEKNFSEGETETIKLSFSKTTEDESNDLEEIEVPKVLGDIFESIAGAIFLDNGQSLDGVWKVYYRLLKPEIDYFSENIPIMPVQQVWELCHFNKCEPDFGKSEKSGRKTRVVLKIVGNKSDYTGAGKEYGGVGKNRKFAKIAASKGFLKDMKQF